VDTSAWMFALRKELGTFEIDLTLDELEDMRHAK